MTRGVENIWISFGNIPILKLYATQWFSREKIKWLLQIIWNMSWEFQRINFKVLLELIFNLREDDMTSSIYLNDKGCWEYLNFIWKYSNSETLCDSMIFTREDKMTSSNYMKYELGVSKDQFQGPFGINFQFGFIWVLFKLFFSKNKIHGK